MWPPGMIASLVFPWWIRLTHFNNLLFSGLLVRSDPQIAGALPWLCWNNGCDPDSAPLHLRHQRAVHEDLNRQMATHPQTIHAYEMTGEALLLEQSAPLSSLGWRLS